MIIRRGAVGKRLRRSADYVSTVDSSEQRSAPLTIDHQALPLQQVAPHVLAGVRANGREQQRGHLRRQAGKWGRRAGAGRCQPRAVWTLSTHCCLRPGRQTCKQTYKRKLPPSPAQPHPIAVQAQPTSMYRSSRRLLPPSGPQAKRYWSRALARSYLQAGNTVSGGRC